MSLTSRCHFYNMNLLNIWRLIVVENADNSKTTETKSLKFHVVFF